MSRSRIASLVSIVLAATLVALPALSTSAEALPSAGPPVASASAAASSVVSLPGSSVVPVSPTVLFRGKATKARNVSVAGRGGLPNDGAGAAVVDVASSRGKVSLWSAGASKPKDATVAGPTGVAVVRLGKGGDLTVQGGGRRVTVTLLGWLPETSDVLLVPDRRIFDGKLGHGASAPLTVTDSLTPSGASGVLLRVRAVTKKKGALGVGPLGTQVKVPTLTYSRSVRDTVTWVGLGPGGKVSLKNLAGPASRVAVDVLGWATPGALTVPASTRIADGKVKAKRKRIVKVPGAASVGAGWVRLTVQAPKVDGSLLLYGEGGKAAASRLTLTKGSAGAVTALVRVPTSGKVTIASKAKKPLKFVLDLVAGLPRAPAEGATRMVLPATTRLGGPSDVISHTATTVTLRAGTDTPPVGGHLVLAPSSDARFGGLIAKVTAVAPGAGSVVVAYTPAAIHEAFDDFDTEYHGAVIRPAAPHAVEPAKGRGGRSGRHHRYRQRAHPWPVVQRLGHLLLLAGVRAERRPRRLHVRPLREARALRARGHGHGVSLRLAPPRLRQLHVGIRVPLATRSGLARDRLPCRSHGVALDLRHRDRVVLRLSARHDRFRLQQRQRHEPVRPGLLRHRPGQRPGDVLDDLAVRGHRPGLREGPRARGPDDRHRPRSQCDLRSAPEVRR